MNRVLSACAFVALMLPLGASATSWSGCNIGIDGAAGWGEVSLGEDSELHKSWYGEDHLSLSGGQIGGHAGCDWEMLGGFVLGLEGDAAYSGIGHSISNVIDADIEDPDVADLHVVAGWNTDLSVRAGAAIGSGLVYARVGVAFTGLSARLNVHDDYVFKGTQSRFGYLAGVGYEQSFADNWSARLEYDYRDFGKQRFAINDVDPSDDEHYYYLGKVSLTEQAVKLAVIYRL